MDQELGIMLSEGPGRYYFYVHTPWKLKGGGGQF